MSLLTFVIVQRIFRYPLLFKVWSFFVSNLPHWNTKFNRNWQGVFKNRTWFVCCNRPPKTLKQSLIASLVFCVICTLLFQWQCVLINEAKRIEEQKLATNKTVAELSRMGIGVLAHFITIVVATNTHCFPGHRNHTHKTLFEGRQHWSRRCYFLES